jgi:hypothetical protein
MRASFFRGASPRRTPLHTRSRGPHDPLSARVAHLLALVRSARVGIRLIVTTLALVAIGGGSSVFACPQCFGAEETSMVDGTKLGVLVMLTITLVVQGGFAGFFFYLRRRAKRIADIELDTEWSDLQNSPRTS